jgi:transposase-like protein
MTPSPGQLTLSFIEPPAEVCALCPSCGTASPVKHQFTMKDVYKCPSCGKTFEVLTPRRAKERRR